MRDRQGSHRWGPAIAVLLVAVILPLLYPLSVGPAVLLFESAGRPQPLERLLDAVYDPLESVPEPCYSWLCAYADLWRP